MVAKDGASRYIGGPTLRCLKVKVRHEGRFVVIGLDVPLAGLAHYGLGSARFDRASSASVAA